MKNIVDDSKRIEPNCLQVQGKYHTKTKGEVNIHYLPSTNNRTKPATFFQRVGYFNVLAPLDKPVKELGCNAFLRCKRTTFSYYYNLCFR